MAFEKDSLRICLMATYCESNKCHFRWKTWWCIINSSQLIGTGLMHRFIKYISCLALDGWLDHGENQRTTSLKLETMCGQTHFKICHCVDSVMCSISHKCASDMYLAPMKNTTVFHNKTWTWTWTWNTPNSASQTIIGMLKELALVCWHHLIPFSFIFLFFCLSPFQSLLPSILI